MTDVLYNNTLWLVLDPLSKKKHNSSQALFDSLQSTESSCNKRKTVPSASINIIQSDQLTSHTTAILCHSDIHATFDLLANKIAQ
jgi:hypothetical protein